MVHRDYYERSKYMFINRSALTMRNITNAEFYQIDDINFAITGYAIGTEDVSTDPVAAWEFCKTLR